MKKFNAQISDVESGDLLGEHINIDPETIEKGLVKLVLMVVETVRQVVERQAIRRVEGGTLTEEEIERLGLALLRLEQQMEILRGTFGLNEDELVLRIPFPV
jgi:hypothetical protein